MNPAFTLLTSLLLAPLAPLHATDRPHVLPTVRTFMNFGGDAEWMRDKIDLTFRLQAKQGRSGMLAIRYALVCTMIEPSEKADALRKWCAEQGFDHEDCFIHFAEDTKLTLHVGSENAASPRQTRTIPGWDARNDADRDGRVSDAEFASRPNAKASARQRREARVPIYYWGPPADDFVMNVGFTGYQRFIAEHHAPAEAAGWDGIFFDTVPRDVAGPGRSAAVVEYPRQGLEADRWQRDLQQLFAGVKRQQPGKLFVANGWEADPLVVDGFQQENWLNLATPAHEWRRRIDLARQHDRLGHVQLLQYNPVHEARLVEFGAKLPGVSRERDQLFGLASYLMAHGGSTYFGFGLHPYDRVTELWFDAVRVDLGDALGESRPWEPQSAAVAENSPNLLHNGSLDSLADWRLSDGVTLDAGEKHEGGACLRIDSADAKAIRIHSQNVTLKPRTGYTLSAWIKTANVRGNIGTQIYPYDFTKAATAPVEMLTVTGTTAWTHHEMTFTTADDAEGRISFRISEALGTAWFDDLRLTEGTAAPRPQVFVREFSKGIVLIRPAVGMDFSDATALEIPLKQPLRPVRADGRLEDAVSSIQLRNGEAAILLH